MKKKLKIHSNTMFRECRKDRSRYELRLKPGDVAQRGTLCGILGWPGVRTTLVYAPNLQCVPSASSACLVLLVRVQCLSALQCVSSALIPITEPCRHFRSVQFRSLTPVSHFVSSLQFPFRHLPVRFPLSHLLLSCDRNALRIVPIHSCIPLSYYHPSFLYPGECFCLH